MPCKRVPRLARPTSAPRLSYAARHGRPVAEHLEPRALLASTFFAGVGMAFAPSEFGGFGVDIFLTEGAIDNETGVVSGDVFRAASGGRDYDKALAYDRVFYLNDGRQERDDDRGFNNFYAGENGEVNGAQFLSSRGFGAGWWLGDLQARAQELELMVELGQGVRSSDLDGSYRFSLIGVDFRANEYISGSGRLTIDNGEIDWDLFAGFGPTGSTISTVSDLGIAQTDEDEWLYLSRDGDSILFVDMDTRDDLIFFGLAVNTDPNPRFDDLVGGYNTAWAYAGEEAQNRSAPNDVLFQQTYLDLEQDGDYKLYDLDDWDSGIRDEPIEIGFWSVSNDRLRLNVRDRDEARTLFVGQDGKTLLGVDYLRATSGSAVLAVATRAFPNGDGGGGGGGGGGGPVSDPALIAVPGLNGFGRQAVYERRSDNMWYESDLVRLAGGPSITGDLVTWVDAKDGLTYAAAVTADGVVLYTQTASGVWAFRDLTSELAGERVIQSLALMIDPNDNAHLVGLAVDGDVLRYHQTGQGNRGNWNWAYQNISTEDLEPRGVNTPAYAGHLVAFATSWGGLNVVGLDAQGTIWSVWWAPGLLDWRASDLTTAYGADPLAGGLTVFLTSWNGINIAGLDDTGQLRVTWWVPSFGGNWAQSNLTTDAGGPTLRAESVSSFVTSWNALNVAGIDDATGEVVTYWWAPALVETGWAVASISDIVPNTSPDLQTSLLGLAGDDNSLNLFGYDATADFIRYYWEPTFGGSWLAENLTDVAVSL